MRKITDHIANPVNDKLAILVLDSPGHGGANHVYAISGMDLARNTAALQASRDYPDDSAVIIFQCGPIKEHGVNGVTQEALLAIVIDRLRCFQVGPFQCDENEDALNYATRALKALKRRTEARMARGVEGQNVA